MGWTDLFKSKKGPDLKPDPRIRWFGKLPTYADYYTSTSDAEWAAEFNEWVLKGYEFYHKRAQDRTAQGDDAAKPGMERLPLAGCVLRLPKSGMTCFASIQDYGGDMRGRHFPITFFAGYPSALWTGPGSNTLSPALRVVERMMALRDDVLQHFRSPGRFESRFGDREADFGGIEEPLADEEWRRLARALDFGEWFDAVRPGLKFENAALWCQAVSRWGKGIAQHDSDEFEPTFRFPLAMSMSIDAQVTGWIRWLESRMNMKDRLLSLIMTAGGGDGIGSFVVIARALVPDDFLLITPLCGALTYLDDVTLLEPQESEQSDAASVPKTWEDFTGQ